MEINPRLSASRSLIASRALGRSFYATRLMLKKRLWIWPIVAAAVLLLVGWGLRRAVNQSLSDSIGGQLQAILDADVAALDKWMKAQESYARIAAEDPRILDLARELIALGSQEGATSVNLSTAPARAKLTEALQPWFDRHSFRGYVVCDLQEKIVAAKDDELIGKGPLPGYRDFVGRVLRGELLVSKPFRSNYPITDPQGRTRAGVPTMFAAAPIRDEQGAIVGALGLRIALEIDFTRILNVARMGDSGETYAFDRNGLLLSQSRFDDQLKTLNLIPDREDSQSILNLELRDPLVDISRGQQATVRRSQLPFTYLVVEAIGGRSGVNIEGYRDYRGSLSYGAWKWLDMYDMGVGTEVDIADAARAGQILSRAFWSLFALLTASCIAIFVFTIVMARLRQQARQAALSAKKLGRYTLEEEIGAGGMGVVYRGHHDMLRRPTAVKLLDVDKTTDEGIKRFEREVSLTSQLNHPNTIAIYDYGRTPEGIFYYAMELLEGLDLEKLVRLDGPQPEGRVIHILLQVCGSLGEAHRRGLIHRDIKPANIFLTERGGVPDFVKLLDFGLVKAVDSTRETQVTRYGALTGTPLYMAPEAIQTAEKADARSDLYALGAVGYYLATGAPPFDGKSIVELCTQHVSAKPMSPSERLGNPLSSELQAAIMGCLEKQPMDRPQSAAALAEALRRCPTAASWTEADAMAWWSKRAQTLTSDTIAESTSFPTNGQAATDHTAG